ncbi:hypothetical protein HHUSO_G36574 [Huso huso]|uniref:Secreted protein n=1 Tax=Huso huso TaxID=61971 RepID=A0ABR0Y0R1_HUSHU
MDLFWILLLLWLFVIIEVKTVQELRSRGAHFFSALNQILTAGTHLHRAAIQLGEAVFQFCKAAAHLIGILFQLLKLIYHLIGVVVYLQDGPQDRILPSCREPCTKRSATPAKQGTMPSTRLRDCVAYSTRFVKRWSGFTTQYFAWFCRPFFFGNLLAGYGRITSALERVPSVCLGCLTAATLKVQTNATITRLQN